MESWREDVRITLDKCQQVGSHPSQRAVNHNDAWGHSSGVRDGSVQGDQEITAEAGEK